MSVYGSLASRPAHPTRSSAAVITDPSMPAMAANAYSILFGDFARHYVIRDVQGVRFERSDDFAFANDLVTLRALLRTEGTRVDLNAVKAYRNSAS
jgi:HK97 family phage major capsid protein